MSELTKEQLHVLQHTTGVSNGENRNYFYTGEGSVDFPICNSLVDAGLMVSRDGHPLLGGGTVFHATEEGKRIATTPVSQ